MPKDEKPTLYDREKDTDYMASISGAVVRPLPDIKWPVHEEFDLSTLEDTDPQKIWANLTPRQKKGLVVGVAAVVAAVSLMGNKLTSGEALMHRLHQVGHWIGIKDKTPRSKSGLPNGYEIKLT